MFAVTSPWLCWTLLSVSLLGFTCAGSFVVNVTQTSYQAEENHNITLEWTFTVETGRSPTYLIIYCDLITGRVQGDKDALREGRIRLQLCKLRTEDSGQYKCKVNTDYGLSSASCRLNVTAATSQEERDWKIITIVLTAAAALVALLMCALLWTVFRKKC
ncbi:uncharacterized protein LOC113019554 isoform X2 [Astatotilapia calliptera]|uniref:uncharacterized protein LOC113019554 isoform X2 n=1 Tax=Astatotilapia calliptera TaxID=8154 RepID=UPI000E41D937|nr:uncharacterized protein LOC113019554 isoform X2 [Astatotilapia calliptera]